MSLLGFVLILPEQFLRRTDTTTLPHPAMFTNGASAYSSISTLFAPCSFFVMLTLRHLSSCRFLVRRPPFGVPFKILHVPPGIPGVPVKANHSIDELRKGRMGRVALLETWA